MSEPNLVWFRQDLRLEDNPALKAAANAGSVLPIYILDDENSGPWKMGAASRWWLHHSLHALNKSLKGKLWVMTGDPKQLIPRLVSEHGVKAVYWNRCYEPWRRQRDTEIKQALEADGTQVFSSKGSLLWEPWENLKSDGTPYRVFTPFYRSGISRTMDLSPLVGAPGEPKLLGCAQSDKKIDELGLLPSIPWYSAFGEHFTPGEAGAQTKLQSFLNQGITNYKAGRDFPAMENVSRLSPHLHFGEISPHRIWQESEVSAARHSKEEEGEHFQRELAWREFSYSLIYHFPELTDRNMNQRFDHFPWEHKEEFLKSWQNGLTGYPLVDAGMRELWQTGYMHNRVRMVVGSFLVKNLLQHWQEGMRWFWDCLLDADLANNTCSWQWVAGCGADAAPYFRVFNPVTQSAKFSTEPYIRRYVPELAKLSDKYIHQPNLAPQAVLDAAEVRLGENYPYPIVDLKESREQALAAYKSIQQ